MNHLKVDVSHIFQESRDNWGLIYPPEDKEPVEFGDEIDKEEQYRLSVEWLYESDSYNEFMCEEDYEVDDKTGENKDHELLMTYDEFAGCDEKPKKKGKKRGRSPSPTPKSRKGKS